jgi:hypothetical protein
MAIELTFHGFRTVDAGGAHTPHLPAQTGDAVTVADGAVSAGLADGGIYRVVATSACRVRFGSDPADATGGEYWPQGHVALRTVAGASKVAVDAIA